MMVFVLDLAYYIIYPVDEKVGINLRIIANLCDTIVIIHR
jgi:hypothetical protein